MAVAAAGLPYKLALPLAALGGVVAGLGLEALAARAPAREGAA
jgi:hypothetical protein